MVCFTRGKNLREEMCQAKLPPRLVRPVEDGFKRCGRGKCRLCPYTNLRLGQVLKSVTIRAPPATCFTLAPAPREIGLALIGHSTVESLGRVQRRDSVDTEIV